MEFKNYFKKNGYKLVTEVLLEIVIIINFNNGRVVFNIKSFYCVRRRVFIM